MQKLLTDEGPRLWDEVVKRTSGMDEWNLPPYAGGRIAGEELLRRAGYRPALRLPRRWTESIPGSFRQFERDGVHVRWVRSIGGNLWFMTRAIYDGTYHTYQELTYIVGPLLILTRGYHAAMRLAEWCNPLPPLKAPAVAWSLVHE